MKHKISNMVKAMKGWESKVADPIKVPKGQFGHKVTIKTGKAKMLNTELDMEFDIPFDDDVEPNEAEIIIYNLSKTTLSQIKRNEVVTVDAGYTGDTGIIFSGRISKVKTKHLGSDMQTTIYAIDSGNLKDSKVKSIAYKKGAKASYILKDLMGD